MKNTYIIGGRRSPIVVSQGKFAHLRPEIIGAKILAYLEAYYQLADKLSGVIAGNAVGTGGNIARLMLLEAGLPEAVPAFTVDMQCSSGLESLAIAQAKIASGQGTCYIAGGMESASLQPLRIYAKNDERHAHYENGAYMTAQFAPNILSETVMLEGAEAVIKSEGISVEELNRWVIRSHERAFKAGVEGIFKDIILPIEGHSFDDGISKRMNERLLKRLPKVLGEGTLTNAGNACRINDGAAFLVLADEEQSKQLTTDGIAYRLIKTVECGTNFKESPRGAMLAADKLLQTVDMSYDDLTAIEFNEAFAVIDVLFERKYPHLVDNYNIFGGALAYGHPYGASGAIIVLHLMRALAMRQGRFGLAGIAGAGGMGVAILIERVKIN